MTKPRPDLSNAVWRKASLSTETDKCVEVAHVEGVVAMRDSKQPEGPVLIFTPAEWRAFLGGANLGEFDLPY